ncbi:MAG: hypothetical protein WD733_05265 [Bryobacterales bacterium]
MSTLIAERRKSPRQRTEIPQGIRISTDSEPGGSRTLAAKLVDAGETGIGVDTCVALRVGSTVAVEGKLRHRSYSLALKGQARVVQARALGDGVYRIGLSFEDVAYRRAAK